MQFFLREPVSGGISLFCGNLQGISPFPAIAAAQLTPKVGANFKGLATNSLHGRNREFVDLEQGFEPS